MASVDANGIAVIGGGVVGVASALTLQIAGYQTVLIERSEPGHGCSFGNAGVIATSFVLPLSSPRHIVAAPRMLLDPLGPLAIRYSDLRAIAPWLGRFLLNATPWRQRRTIDGLKSLNALALPAWAELLNIIDQRHHLIERGMLDVATSISGLKSLRKAAARLRSVGIALSELDACQICEIEPVLRGRIEGGLLHHDVAHVADPLGLTQALLTHFLHIGGKLTRTSVRAVVPANGRVRVNTDAGPIDVSQTIVAAGYGSAALLTRLGIRAPLGVEHGYHVMIPEPEEMPSRPVSFHTEAFLATPMQRGLRLAGTVELARANAAPNWKRADRLLDLARRHLPDLEADGASRWMGGRPSFPDSLPAIGRLAEAPQIIYAFGHQHLGLTLAAITAKSVLALVSEQPSPLPLEGYSLERFGQPRRGE